MQPLISSLTRRSPFTNLNFGFFSCCFRLSRLPALKLSSTITSLPISINLSTKCDPMNPAPPVTSILSILSIFYSNRYKS